MGFRKLRLFPITGIGNDGYPTVGTPIQLQVATVSAEFNSVKISTTDVKKTKTLNADDKEQVIEKSIRYEGELEVFNIEATAQAEVFGYTKDTKGNVIQKTNSTTKKSFVVFFEGQTATGVIYQKYLYSVTFKEPETHDAETDDGTKVPTLKVAFNGADLLISGSTVRAATVYATNVGFIANDAEPTTIYKEATGA